MSKALITGGAGFIGFHLAKELVSNGYRVDLVDNFARGVEDRELKELCASGKVRMLAVDMLNRDAIFALGSDYNYIYHLAAIIGVEHVLKRSYDVLRLNMELLYNAIDFARTQKHLARFVFASTSEIYAGTLQYFDMEIPTPETTPLAVTDLRHPRTSYMLSKIYGEAVLNQSGLPFMIIRPHNFYGPRMGMSHVIPQQLQKVFLAKDGDAVDVFSPEHKRTFCYIKDAADVICRLSECDASLGEAYNIGNEAPEISILDVVKIIVRTVGRDVQVQLAQEAAGSPVRRCPSMRKVYGIIDQKPSASLEEGIKRVYDWYRDNVFSGKEVCAK